MPELCFRLRWPDDTETMNYSPSTIVKNYLAAGTSYEIGDFITRSRLALQAASARVEQIHGYPCARARASLAAIEQQAAQFAQWRGAIITVLAVSP